MANALHNQCKTTEIRHPPQSAILGAKPLTYKGFALYGVSVYVSIRTSFSYGDGVHQQLATFNKKGGI